jgi:hypothetical protein
MKTKGIHGEKFKESFCLSKGSFLRILTHSWLPNTNPLKERFHEKDPNFTICTGF